MRIVERFPGWFPTLDTFNSSDEELRAKLITYEIVRESEDAEKMSLLRQMIAESSMMKTVR